MTMHVKDGGTWKEVTGLYVRDAGTWKAVTNGSVRDAGTWKEFYGSAGGYDYSILATPVTTGSTGSTVDLALDSNAATGETWTVTSVGSSPAGFYDSSSFVITGDSFGTINFQSICKPASAGTRILLNYNVSCVVDGLDTVAPLYLQVAHQF